MPPAGRDSTDAEDIPLVWWEWVFIQYGGDVIGDITGASSSARLSGDDISVEDSGCGALDAFESVSASVSVVGGEGGGFGRSVACDRFLCTIPVAPPLTLEGWVSTMDAIRLCAGRAGAI